MTKKRKSLLAALVPITFFVIFVYITRDTWRLMLKISLLSLTFSLPLIPFCRRLESKGIKREAAAFISLLSCVCILFFFLLIFIPYLITKTIELTQRMTPTILSGIQNAEFFLQKWGIDLTLNLDWRNLLTSTFKPLSGRIARGGIALFAASAHTMIALVIAYYLLTVRHIAGKHILLLLPPEYRVPFLGALSGCKNAVLCYLSGLAKTSLFVGLVTFIGLIFLGLKDAWILGLFMGILEILPYFGPVLGAIPIIISAIPLGLSKTMLAVLIVFFVQQLEASVAGPYFTASSTSIHPLTAIIGVLLGGSLFGILGALFTLPIIIMLRSMFWSLRTASFHID